MKEGEVRRIFKRYAGNPILTADGWPYEVNTVFNPGAAKFDGKILLAVRAEDWEGYSHLARAQSKDGRMDWRIDSQPMLTADAKYREGRPGLEDARIVWIEELRKFVISCVSFCADVAGEPSNISLITTRDFSSFERLPRPLIPPNKDASLFPELINGRFALVNRPIVEGRYNIWVSFSDDLKSWSDHRVLLSTRPRTWDSDVVGLGPPPIKTSDGWLILYHGARNTASGINYRVGAALLDLETLEVIRRSHKFVLGPKEPYERVGDVDDIIFPCGAVVDEKTNELLVYYGAADTVVGLATASLQELLDYLKTCPSS